MIMKESKVDEEQVDMFCFNTEKDTTRNKSTISSDEENDLLDIIHDSNCSKAELKFQIFTC